MSQSFTIMAAGIIGALAYTFTDSFWFSAVEGEVYALSSFFTALVFWAMLKWEHADYAAGTDPYLRIRADRWIIFIFFMMGLSIGVHLLNLLTIPAIVMIYYYKRYNYTRKGAIWAFIIGCLITGIVQVAVIQWTIKLAGRFDILFVNNFGLPFFSGFVFFFILLGIAIWFGLRYARQKGYSFLQLGLWSFIFMLIGYSMYVTTLQRSNANPSIDMNNVDNPMSLVYYLGREQYGSAPLLYGPHFQAEYERDASTGGVKFKDGEMKYTRGKDAYIPIGKQQEPEYVGSDKQLFPRVWDRSNDQGHADFYADWLNLARTENSQTGEVSYEAPSYADNINWFVTYQMGFMYWRYFMWNFAGKQNDIQGFGSKRDGNWITGIPVIDNARLGDQSMMPESLKKNKANNKLFLLPFILGILGCVYHYLKDRQDWIVTFLLFFFTGLAIVLYLNQPGNQPRERDYAFVGSFYAFSVWIGLSVIALVRMAKEREKQTWLNTLIYGSIGTFVVGLLSNTTTTFSGALISSIFMAVLYAAVVAILGYAVRAASGKNFNLNTATATAFALCMVTPVIMLSQEWNDHDRSEKTLAPAMARNYLMALAPNAIIFTFGDNDTYPLWYAQEVENVRPDLRIVNTSLLGIDWYVNQLRYKLNESPPFDLIWTEEQIAGLAYIRFRPQGPQDRSYPLYDVMKNVIGPALNVEDKANLDVTYPVKRFRVSVDSSAAKTFSLNPDDRILPEFEFSIPEGRNYLTLDQLTMLNIIASTNWQRPIYFTSSSAADQLGFGQFLRKEGLSLRLVPAVNEYPQQNWLVDQALRGGNIKDNNLNVMYRTLMNDFSTGGAQKPGVYFDEENRRHLLSVRAAFAEGAGNISDKGRKPEAIKLLDRSESLINTVNMPYAMASRYNSHNQTALMYLEAAYKAGHTQLANKIKTAVLKDLNDQKAYYDYLRNEKEAFYTSVAREAEINNFLFQLLEALEKNYNPTQVIPEAPRRAADSTEIR